MFAKLLIALLIFVLLIFAIAFFTSGGLQEVQDRKDSYTNPLAFLFDGEADEFSFADLPIYTQPFGYNPIRLPDTEDGVFLSNAYSSENLSRIQSNLISLEDDYDSLQDKVREVKEFGTPSPYRGEVSISSFILNLQKTDPQEEYLALTASFSNTSPINITGWSLQSITNGARASLPIGVRILTMGIGGSPSDVYVDPGKSAYVVTGSSPVGVSFRENICSGYLNQFQTFTPDVDQSCPTPREELPNTADNIATYGESCIDFVRTVGQCRHFIGSFPNNITNSCQSFVKNVLTYNGCVQRNQWRPSFSTGDWRLYLGRSQEMWNNSHDVIRLLDTEGRTVDVWSY